MRIFGIEIPFGRRKAATLNGVDDSRGWIKVFESFAGAWQQNVEVDHQAVLSNWAVFACMTLIAGDVGKLRVKLVQQGDDGIWRETRSPAFSPVLTKPNHYQTRQKFFESWMFSKLSHGNTYILKERDARGVVVRLHVLDPSRVRPLVSDSGDVFYQLGDDDLAGIPKDVAAAPATEIIHDRMWCLFHPLVGLSPIYASGLAATQGMNIQTNSSKFFQNMSRPSGVLTAPGNISDATAQRLKSEWEKNFSGEKVGRVAVLGDGLKYEAMSVTPQDALLVEQLKISAEMVCTTFHVPGYKVGVGPMPTYQNAEVLNQIYYSDCLQVQIEGIEALLDEGLGATAAGYGTEFDLDALLRMDSKTQVEVLKEAVGSGVMAPNEARRRLNYEPVEGGDTPYLQQQNYSLSALDRRDNSQDPFGNASTQPAAPPAAKADATAFDTERLDDLQAELKAIRDTIAEERARAVATDSKRSAQLAELLGDVHRQIDSISAASVEADSKRADQLTSLMAEMRQQIEALHDAQRTSTQRQQDAVDAVQKRAVVESFARMLECSPGTTH